MKAVRLHGLSGSRLASTIPGSKTMRTNNIVFVCMSFPDPDYVKRARLAITDDDESKASYDIGVEKLKKCKEFAEFEKHWKQRYPNKEPAKLLDDL